MNRMASLLAAAMLLHFLASIPVAGDLAPEAKALFIKQTTAMMAGDSDAYMTTLDPSSPVYASTKTALGLIRGRKLRVALDSYEVISLRGLVGRVRTVITTRGDDARTFKDNTITALHTLHLVGGKWLLYSSKIERNKYL